MNFIITRFLRMISRDYGFDYTLTRNPDGTYTCCVTKIPAELKIKLVKAKYSFVAAIREVKDKHGNLIRTEDVVSTNAVCDGICNPMTGVHGICIIFSEKDYANKVNTLDYELRRYYENHSRIDEINNKS